MRGRKSCHRHAMRAVTLLALSLLLAGCASMSQSECATADWYDRGMRDALSGFPRARLQDHRNACAKIGVEPVAPDYMQGHAIGSERFCLPANAADWGRQGRSYQRSCPAEIEPEFLHFYSLGRAAYDAEQEVDRLVSQQRSKQDDLEKAKDEDSRKRLREELVDLDRRLRTAREALDYAERRYQRGG